MSRSGRLFATVVAAAVVSLMSACGSDDDPALEPPRTTGAGQPGAGSCSAAGVAAPPEDQAGLPDEVRETRRLIVGAASGCGYARLGHIAQRGERPFSFSFGEDAGGQAAADFWRAQEAEGREPLRFLVGLLDRPFVERDAGDGSVQYVWPSAFGYESWSEVPEDDRDALRPLYDDTDFASFEAFGAYAGYRVGIASDGEWLFFVAGD